MVNPLCHEYAGLRFAVLASDHVEASHVTSCTRFARLFDPKRGGLQEKIFVIRCLSFERTALFLMQIPRIFQAGKVFVLTYSYLAFSLALLSIAPKGTDCGWRLYFYQESALVELFSTHTGVVANPKYTLHSRREQARGAEHIRGK